MPEGGMYDHRPRTAEWYGRLGAAINRALEGSTEHEKRAGEAAVIRMMMKLTPAERRILMQGLPGSSSEHSYAPPRSRRRTGTKRERIVDLLQRGFKPSWIASNVGTRVQYVHRIKKEEGL